MFVLKRSKNNPLISPVKEHHWEASATFNMTVVKSGKKFYGLYRAISDGDRLRIPQEISVIGIAESSDGEVFDKRRVFIEPEEEWEKFGCEDPRTTFFEGKYYTFYTALSVYPFAPEGIRVAVGISDTLDRVDERHQVTTFNSKAMTLFPERINGKVTVLFSSHTDGSAAKMSFAQADKIEEFWSPEFWDNWYHQMDSQVVENLRRNDFDHVEVGATPIKTEHGWLVIYSHIENFFPSPEGAPRFGVEALLLDLNDPRKVIGRTKGPMLIPEEPYEIYGQVANIVFPTGTLVQGDTLTIYYGGADTTICAAKVSLKDLISTMNPETKVDWHFKRYEKNPILLPRSENGWESKAVFNPATIEIDGTIHIVYRALSEDNTSTLGYASTKDGFNIETRLDKPIYVPREDFELKKIENGNSGCEDPRLTKIGKNIYMCYTAYNGLGPPRVAVTAITEQDFLMQRWRWEKPALITPESVDDKDACVFPEKVGGKFFIMHRIGTEICGDFLTTLDFTKEAVRKCIHIFGPRVGMWDSDKVGISAPPMKVKEGWLLLYHAVSKNHHTYRVGAVLLDPKDPTIVLARSTDPIFEPQEKYEKEGIVNNVVFPCGMVERHGLVYIYYGGADKVVGVATMKLSVIVDSLFSAKEY